MESIEGFQFIRFILALGIVLVGLCLFAYLGKRVLNRQNFSQLKSGKNLRVLEEISLAQQRRLVLIGVNQDKVLLLLSARGDYIQVIPNREENLIHEKK
ncbi:MAG: flagellar biosynthetic protein FliO [Alphaproteobacteria bacterium]